MKRSNAARTACLALALVLAAACLAGCESAQGGAADFGGEMPEGMELPEGMDLPEGMEPPEGTGTGTAGGTGTVGGTGTAGGGAQSQTLQVEVAETVTGEVESIVGNEVTLLLTDGTAAPAEPEAAATPAATPAASEAPAETEDAEAAQTEETESSAQATATYLLPVGMPIGAGDYSTVSTGMVLELSLDADGDVVAASVR